MPAIKVKPSPTSKKRDFWGDKTDGQKFQRLFRQKFGNKFGAVQIGLKVLGLHRRLFNMYLTGERAIPIDLWQRLKTTPVWDDGIDPLS